MATGKEQATFTLNLAGNAGEVSDKTASSLDRLRAAMQGSQEKLRGLVAAERALRGSSEDVLKAKSDLKKQIDAERNALSAGNLQILKAGATYDALQAKIKKAAAAQAEGKARTDAINGAISKAGGPLADMRDRFAALGEVVGGAGGKLALFVGGATAVVAALALIAGGAIAATVAFAKFVITGSNAARSANLLRETFTGSADDAERLGGQVDALASKVSTSKSALNELAVSLRKNRLGGQELVDTFNAVGQASAAAGDGAGKALQDIVERGRMSGRISINPQELLGTGVDFTEIAKALASQMHVGVDQATQALFEGRVKLADGAKAIRAGVEKQFAGINLRKMLDVEVLTQKFHETLDALTKGVKLDPLLEKVAQFGKLFSADSQTGAALKELVTDVGQGLVDALAKGIPIAESFFEGLVNGALELENNFLELKLAWVRAFGDKDALANLDLAKTALGAGEIAVKGLAIALGLAAAGLASVVAGVAVLAAPFILATAAVVALKNLFVGTDWKALGASLADGLASGVRSRTSVLIDAVKGLAQASHHTFRDEMEIHSPSRVMAAAGEELPEGVAVGVDRGAPKAQAAVERMVTAPGLGGAGGGGGGSPISVTINLNVSGGGDPGATARAVSDESILRKLTKAVQDALVGAGIPAEVA